MRGRQEIATEDYHHSNTRNPRLAYKNFEPGGPACRAAKNPEGRHMKNHALPKNADSHRLESFADRASGKDRGTTASARSVGHAALAWQNG
jgi:hypothetical protein